MAQVGAPGTVTIDTDSLTREPTPAERAAAEERKRKHEEILRKKGLMPGQPGSMPGTLQIDPVAAGWELPDGPSPDSLRDTATIGYKSQKLGYNPYTTQMGSEQQGMNYNPYKQAAQNQASSQAQSDYGRLLSGLQTSGGVSASDRMSAMTSFNRQKILGQLGGASKFDQAQSQSNLGADQMNAQRGLDVSRINTGAANEASRYGAQAELRRNENLYGGAVGERDLRRRLDASKAIGKAQGDARGSMDWIMDPSKWFS